MSRKLLSVLLLVTMLMSFTLVAQAQNPDCQGDVTLTYWHHWGGNRIPIMQSVIAAFEVANPGICVNNIFLPWDNRLPNLLTAVAAGSPPDVTMFGRQDLPFFAATDSIIALDEYMAADGISADMFVPAEFGGNQYDGKTWMLPNPTGGALGIAWYNMKHLADAGFDSFPETWEELAEAGMALRIGADGFLDRVGVNVNAQGFLYWLNANGQDWISADLRTVTINNQAGYETLDFIQSFTDDINFGVEEVSSFYEMTGEFDQTPLILGFDSIQISGSWQLFQLESHGTTEVFGDDGEGNLGFAVAPMPYGPSGNPGRRGPVFGGWGFMIPRNAPHPDEAWQLVKWMTAQVESNVELELDFDEAGALLGVGDVNGDGETTTSMVGGACWFLQQQQRPSPLAGCDGYAREGVSHRMAEDILGVAVLDSVIAISPVQPESDQIIRRMSDEVLFGEKSIEDALADAEAEIQELLDTFWAQYG
jgi:multiple sugar transport system substrate-binding protein